MQIYPLLSLHWRTFIISLYVYEPNSSISVRVPLAYAKKNAENKMPNVVMKDFENWMGERQNKTKQTNKTKLKQSKNKTKNNNMQT